MKVRELIQLYNSIEKYAERKEKRKWEVETDNYVVERLKRIPKSEQKNYKWRRKVVYDKHGYRHIINLACRGGKCVATSIWHPKEEPMARRAAKKVPKK